MVYFLVLVVFVKVLVVFSEIGVVLVVFGSGGSETLNPTLKSTLRCLLNPFPTKCSCGNIDFQGNLQILNCSKSFSF